MSIRSLAQPVIAAVNGPAAGAGFAIALASDVRVVSTSASFHVAAIRLGLSFLPRHIGAARAFEVMLSGSAIGADEAKRIGLVARVVADGEVVDAAVEMAGASQPTRRSVLPSEADHVGELGLNISNRIEIENRTQILAASTSDVMLPRPARLPIGHNLV